MDGAMSQTEASIDALRRRIEAQGGDADMQLGQLKAALERHLELRIAEATRRAESTADRVAEEVKALRADVSKEHETLRQEIAALRAEVETLTSRTEGLGDFEALVSKRIQELAAADGSFMTSADVQALISEIMARRKKRRW